MRFTWKTKAYKPGFFSRTYYALNYGPHKDLATVMEVRKGWEGDPTGLYYWSCGRDEELGITHCNTFTYPSASLEEAKSAALTHIKQCMGAQ